MDLPNEDAAESLNAFCVPDMTSFMEMQSVITELCLKLINESDSSSCHPTSNTCNYILTA